MNSRRKHDFLEDVGHLSLVEQYILLLVIRCLAIVGYIRHHSCTLSSMPMSVGLVFEASLWTWIILIGLSPTRFVGGLVALAGGFAVALTRNSVWLLARRVTVRL